MEDFGGGLTAYLPLPNGAYPNPEGPLIDQITDADGSNQLINPIDGTPILLDVYGNPRTRQGLRQHWRPAVRPGSRPPSPGWRGGGAGLEPAAAAQDPELPRTENTGQPRLSHSGA